MYESKEALQNLVQCFAKDLSLLVRKGMDIQIAATTYGPEELAAVQKLLESTINKTS